MSPRIACVRIPAPRTALPEPPEPEARVRLARALLEGAPRITPVAGHPRAWWADASGMDLRGGDRVVWAALREAALGAGFPVKVGIADTCIGAAAATREGAGRVVQRGGDAAFLARQSLDVLPIPESLRDTLSRLGLERCGELAGLPPAQVELRFGRDGLLAWRLARAEDPRWPFRPAGPETAAAEIELEPPVEGSEPLRFLLPGLLEALLRELEIRQRIPSALHLHIALADGSTRLRDLRPARPTREMRVLLELCRRALEAQTLPAPVAGLRLEVPEEGVETADQLDVFRRPAPDPAALHSALLPVLSRWGESTLSRAVHEGAHLPGRSAHWEALGPAGLADFARSAGNAPEETSVPPAWSNRLDLVLRRLEPPREAHVTEGGAGRPVRLDVEAPPRLPLELPARLVAAEGPERISGAWWAADPYAREYWRAETARGALLLLFRDARSGAWYLEGWYD